MANLSVLLLMVFTSIFAFYVLAEDLQNDLKAEDTLKIDQVRSNVHEEDARAETNDVSGGSNVMKRGGQVLGIGGRCAWYNEKCRGLTTHCCDPWVCKYKKWYHRLSETGGRCM